MSPFDAPLASPGSSWRIRKQRNVLAVALSVRDGTDPFETWTHSFHGGRLYLTATRTPGGHLNSRSGPTFILNEGNSLMAQSQTLLRGAFDLIERPVCNGLRSDDGTFADRTGTGDSGKTVLRVCRLRANKGRCCESSLVLRLSTCVQRRSSAVHASL
jgi:hypothetical protein